MNQKRILEICANSAASCVEAEAGGRQGLNYVPVFRREVQTPSYGEIRMAKELTSHIDINVIIRPRGGDFLYTPAEIQSMLYDIELAKQLGVHGVVLDASQKKEMWMFHYSNKLVAASKPLSVTFHRAFDVCRDPFEALEQIIAAGCDRILTSGQQQDAVKGIPLLAQLVQVLLNV